MVTEMSKQIPHHRKATDRLEDRRVCRSESYQGYKEHLLSNCAVWQLHLHEPPKVGVAYELTLGSGLQFSWHSMTGGEWMAI